MVKINYWKYKQSIYAAHGAKGYFFGFGVKDASKMTRSSVLGKFDQQKIATITSLAPKNKETSRLG